MPRKRAREEDEEGEESEGDEAPPPPKIRRGPRILAEKRLLLFKAGFQAQTEFRVAFPLNRPRIAYGFRWDFMLVAEPNELIVVDIWSSATIFRYTLWASTRNDASVPAYMTVDPPPTGLTVVDPEWASKIITTGFMGFYPAKQYKEPGSVFNEDHPYATDQSTKRLKGRANVRRALLGGPVGSAEGINLSIVADGISDRQVIGVLQFWEHF